MAVVLTAKNIGLAYDSRPLFEGISLSIHEGERVGFIGPNAAGKSSLLKIIAGQIQADTGDLIFQTNTKVSYVEQDPQFNEKLNILEILTEGIDLSEAWKVQIKAEELLWKLGLETSEFSLESPIAKLSGGWRKRIALLRALLNEPDLLLLDEPTNHLDVEGILWLEEILQNSKFTSLIITHDRLFLQRVSTRILELDRRNPEGIINVKGNYQDYLQAKEHLMSSQETQEASLRVILRRETEWLNAGVKAQRSKAFARTQRHAVLVNELSEVASRNVDKKAQMEFEGSENQPKRLIECKRLEKSFPGRGKLFSNFDLFLGPGTRLGILGENGCGKSTLLKVLLGKEAPDSGKLFHSDLLKISYFEQNRASLDPEVSLMRAVCPYGDAVIYQNRSVHIRTYLDRFLFSQKQMDLPIKRLSGGEQSRVLLAQLMLQECNLLVLDEPTNDLDIASLNVLQDCLTEFEGAILLVSHDRFFLDQVATQILAFPLNAEDKYAGKLYFFADLAQWETWHKENRVVPTSKKAKAKPAAVPKSPSVQKELNQLTRRIEQLEAKYKQHEEDCHSRENRENVQKLVELGQKMKVVQAEIADLYEKWEQLDSEA